MTVENLIAVLRSAGKPGQLHTSPDGTTLVLLPHGARVLGLFASRSHENYYWVNPALLTDPATFFRNEGWHNSGGDRTWLAPEIDLSFPSALDLGSYKVPVEIDPGRYEVERSDQSLRLVNRAKVRLFRSQQTAEVEICKSWSAAANPLRYEKAWKQTASVEYAGYTQRTSLRLVCGGVDETGPIGTWNLIQLPHGGEFFLPTYGEARPTVYFGSIPSEDLDVNRRAIRYKMRSSGIQKIGIRAAAWAGRTGYAYSVADHWVLVVRNIFVDPSAEYIDVPWTSSGDLGERGYAFQACNVNNELGSFSEFEYHTPAIGRGTGRIKHEDASQVWAFRGSQEAIWTIGKRLLSNDF